MSIASVSEARRLLLDAVKGRPTITRPLMESFGYILAEEIATKQDIPSFNKSPYDGFAIACPEEGAKSHTFTVIGRIGAGESFSAIKAGEAVRIMTGAPIPKGADTIAMFEQCDEETTEAGTTIFVRGNVKKGDNIILQGEECKAGDVVLEKGTLVTAGTIALLASLGYTEVPLLAKPKVAILTSGKELVPLGTELPEACIYNSNGPMLEGLLLEEGLQADFYHHVTDDPNEVEAEIEFLRPHLADMDIVISTGGVSVGDFDFMPYIYQALGAKELYNRVAMRPGAAQYGGCSERTIFIGLSGNPSAAFNGFHLVAAPVLRKLKGEAQVLDLPLNCKMGKTIKKHNPFDRYIQGAIKIVNDEPYFFPVTVFSSNAIVNLAMSDALYMMPQGQNEIHEGCIIKALLLQKRGTK